MPNQLNDMVHLCDAIPAAVVAVNAHGKIAFLNTDAESLFRIQRQNILGRDFREIGDPTPFTQIPFSETLEKGTIYTSQERTFYIGGQPFPATFDLTPIFLSDNQLSGALAIIKGVGLSSATRIFHPPRPGFSPSAPSPTIPLTIPSPPPAGRLVSARSATTSTSTSHSVRFPNPRPGSPWPPSPSPGPPFSCAARAGRIKGVDSDKTTAATA